MLPQELDDKKEGKSATKVESQGEMLPDLQKDLEAKFDELFGSFEEN